MILVKLARGDRPEPRARDFQHLEYDQSPRRVSANFVADVHRLTRSRGLAVDAHDASLASIVSLSA